MGYASRSNLRSPDGHKDTAAVYAAQLAAVARTVKTPRQLDHWLEQFPAETRDDVRALVRPLCEWDLAAIQAEDALIARAATMAAQSGGGA